MKTKYKSNLIKNKKQLLKKSRLNPNQINKGKLEYLTKLKVFLIEYNNINN